MADALAFTTAAVRKIAAADKIPFTIDGAEFVLIPPKTSSLGLMLITAEQAEQKLAAGDVKGAAQDMFRAMASLLQHVEQPGQKTIEARMMDPRDSLDVETLMPIFKQLIAAVGGARPTGRRAGSSPKPPASGRPSRARTR